MSRILVVDDDEQLGRSIARVLEREGHETRIAEDLRLAETFTEYRPDLVVVELQTSWVGGLPSLRERFEAVARRPTPFVCTVGRRELYRSIAPAFAIVDDWLAKPFDPEELATRVDTVLRRSATPRV